MNRTIIICRHGEVDNPRHTFYGRTLDISLSQLGKKQISTLGEKIRQLRLPVKSIYTSPLKRAKQTALILSTILKTPVIIKDGLTDVDIPGLVGKPLALRQQIHARGDDEYQSHWVKIGNESEEKVRERMMKSFKEIVEMSQGTIPLIVSHGDPIIFLLFCLENPGKKLPPVGEIIRLGYRLNKGYAVKLILDESLKVVLREPILP